MASANEPGLVKVVVERAGLGQKTAFQYRTDSPVNAGKSPDGVLANLTTNLMVKIGKVNPVIMRGDIIRLMFKPDAVDGIDASDCIIQIPYWENGMLRQLNAADFGFTGDLTAIIAKSWVELGTGYTVPNDVNSAQLGGGDIVISIEDDTA